MRPTSAVPSEFAALSGKIHHIIEVARGIEWSSSCPHCGGDVHRNGEWPDRFRMFRKSKRTGGPLGWCRVCGYTWAPGRENVPDPAEVERLKLLQAEAEKEQERTSQLMIEKVQKAHRWDGYFHCLMNTPAGQEEWKKAGIIDPFWWKYWRLGYDRLHNFWMPNGGEQFVRHQTPTLTIPLMDINGRTINIKHRLLIPAPLGRDARYLMEYRTYKEPVFFANRKLMNEADTAFIVEGEKKAMVLALTAKTHIFDDVRQVIGVPSSPSQQLLESIRAESIVLILDPDIFEKDQRRLNRMIGIFGNRRLRIIRLPAKVDDYILANKKDEGWIRSMWETPTWIQLSKNKLKYTEMT